MLLIMFASMSSLNGRYQSKTRTQNALPHGYQMVWSFFGFSHGKGVHDGASAVLKQEI
jgi:hypothetical protein